MGQRTRRFFPRQVYSDGTIVGYLPAKLNEGLALFHCVHDDGDTEDLDEREAETAVDNFAKKFTKIADSKKAEARRKTQRQRQAEKLAAAQNSLRELGKKMPVECVGYLESTPSVATPVYWSSSSTSSAVSRGRSGSGNASGTGGGSASGTGGGGASGGSNSEDGSSVVSELVVLKRFRDASEAAVALLTCWESQGHGQGLDGEREDGEGSSNASAKGPGPATTLNTAFLRSRLAEMKKCILRCCQGLDVHPNPKGVSGRRATGGGCQWALDGPTYLGFKWQFALPEVPAEEGSDNEGDEEQQQQQRDEREDRDGENQGDEEEEGTRKEDTRKEQRVVATVATSNVAIAVVMEDRTKVDEEGVEGNDRTMSARRSQKPQRRLTETVIVPLTKSVGSRDQLVEVEVQTVRRLRACPELAGNAP